MADYGIKATKPVVVEFRLNVLSILIWCRSPRELKESDWFSVYIGILKQQVLIQTKVGRNNGIPEHACRVKPRRHRAKSPSSFPSM